MGNVHRTAYLTKQPVQMLRSQLDEHRREMDEVKAALAASYQEVRRGQHAVPATAVVKAAVRTLPLGHAVDYCTRCGVTAAWDCTALRSAAMCTLTVPLRLE